MPIIHVPEALREKLGDKASEGLVTLIRDSQEEQKSHLMELVEERFARRVIESEARSGTNLNETQTALRKEMTDGFAAVRREMSDKFAAVRREMSDEFAAVRREMSDGFAAGRKEMSDEFADVRKEMRGGFLRVEEKFTGIQSQITSQTRWLIALIAFIAVAFKLIDLFVK